MLVITGIGRCGTSLVTKWLKECDLKVGSDKWFKVYNAGLENKHTLDINARLVRHYVKGEDINLHHVRGDIEELTFDCVKDTQFLKHPSIIKEWDDVRDISVLWLHRDPSKIVESTFRLPEWNTPVYRCREDLIVQKCDEFKKSLKGMDWEMFMFPDILDDPEPMVDWVWDRMTLPEDCMDIWFNLVDNEPH